MKVKVKIIDKSIPTQVLSYAKPGDAGIDLIATSKSYDENGNVVYGTNLAFEIPVGYVGLLFPRSCNAKMDLLNTNSVGVIDSGYRGEVMMKFKHTYRNLPQEYEIGDRIGQIIILPYPQIELELAEELSVTERGEGDYGSTGN